jgi:hypothetical protein
LTAVLAAALALAILQPSGNPAPAGGSRTPIAMFQEPLHMLTDPAETLSTLRTLGVGVVRMQVQWQLLAPEPTSAVRPPGFDASDPAAYPAITWRPYDLLVTDARHDGIAIDFLITGGAPRWAVGPGSPSGRQSLYWKPSANEYEQFVRAMAKRYSGTYRPCVSCSTLPAVRFWEIWNEPNYGQDLAPQAVAGSSRPTSPVLYRGLLDAGWNALQVTGHGHDTIIMGSLSPRGFKGPVSRSFPQGLPGYFSTTKPLPFLRTLYCVDSDYRQLRGDAASAVGCPTTAHASQQFRAQHPALFGASGFGIHPYPFDLPPTNVDSDDPDYAEFAQLPRLASTLDRLQHAYGSTRRLQIYNTEFGYITDPPNHTTHYGRHFLSPARAGDYLNWAEYLTWRNPRLATTMQYLLYDPQPAASGFATGLLSDTGKPKPTLDTYRLPLYLPATSVAPGHALEIWGCVRPAHLVSIDLHGALQHVQIQFRGGTNTAFRTIATVPIENGGGYFDVRERVPGTGAIRLSWSYPSGQTVYSRTVAVAVS